MVNEPTSPQPLIPPRPDRDPQHPGAQPHPSAQPHPGAPFGAQQHPDGVQPGAPQTPDTASAEADQHLVQAPVPAPPAELDLPLSRRLVGWLRMALGVTAIVIGGLWTLQGLGIIENNAMSGVTLWAIIGPIVAVGGLVLIVLGVKRRTRFKTTGQ